MKKSILTLIILILTFSQVFAEEETLSEHKFLNREREKEARYKAMHEKGMKFGAGFGPAPFIKWFNLDTANKFKEPGTGLSFQFSLTANEKDGYPVDRVVTADFILITSGIELLETDGNWWGTAGDMVAGYGIDISFELSTPINEKVRPFIMLGLGFLNMNDLNDGTRTIYSQGFLGGLGLNAYLSKNISVFCKAQYNLFAGTSEVTGNAQTRFPCHIISICAGMRFYYYYDPYKRYMKEKPKIYRDFEKLKRKEKFEMR